MFAYATLPCSTALSGIRVPSHHLCNTVASMASIGLGRDFLEGVAEWSPKTSLAVEGTEVSLCCSFVLCTLPGSVAALIQEEILYYLNHGLESVQSISFVS